MRTRPVGRAPARGEDAGRRGGGGRKQLRVIEAAAKLRPALARLAEVAREDPAVFCQFVLKHESTGRPIRLAKVHEEWHDTLSAHDRVVLWTFAEGGKTSQISVGRVLWEMGRNPNIRILILSAAAGVARRIVKALKTYIERSPEYRAVFPHVMPDKSDTTGLWRDDAFHIVRATISKDPTVQACGFGGQILGGRYDLIIIDDYLTAENTYSEHLREKFHGWLKSTIESRRTETAPLWFIGNAWHHDDAMHRYAKEPATVSRKYPVRNPDGTSAWPEVWPEERIEREVANRGPIEARRSMFCDPVADGDRRFKSEYILRALRLGDGDEFSRAGLHEVPAGFRIITGVDLGASKRRKSDLTSLATVGVDTRNERRYLLDLVVGKMSGPEIVEAIRDAHRMWHSVVYVESNAAQVFIRQFVEEGTAVPVQSLYTGKNKADPTFGLESIAIEMSGGKWSLPNIGGTLEGHIHPEVMKLINEMLSYDPKSHTGDRLMSLWIAREGARKLGGVETGKRKRRT